MSGRIFRNQASYRRRPSPQSPTDAVNHEQRLNRLRYRAWHRGTREADLLVGGFFDRSHHAWCEADLAWFETLLDEADPDIMAWAMRQAEPPQRLAGPMMDQLLHLKNNV